MSAATKTRSSGPNPWRGEVPPDEAPPSVPDDARRPRCELVEEVRRCQDHLYRLMAHGADHHDIEQARRALDALTRESR